MKNKIFALLAIMLVNLYADEPIMVSKIIKIQEEKTYSIEKAIQIQEKAILLLMKENKILQNRVLKLESETSIKSDDSNEDTNQQLYKVIKRKGIDAYIKPYCNCKVINQYAYEELLQIEYCNNRKWCKIKGKNEYVKQYLLRYMKK